MTLSLAAGLALLLGLQAKHWVFDFGMQSDWQVHNKGTYGHPGGLVHAGLHGVGTLVIMLVGWLAGVLPLELALILAIADVVIHYHVDWAKSQVSRRLNLQPKTKSYWMAFGADQVAHQSTYIGLVAAVGLSV